ncbi:MAG: DUF4197 domain-containing protein [Crocinitomicaceae bacterium]|nr:DUF4197 domain-containing protein [Crocinitomicaceae bacterium]
MNKIYLLLFAVVMTVLSCDTIKEAESSVNNVLNGGNSGNSGGGLTNDEVISGLKSALEVGIKNATNLTSQLDGFNKNLEIRVPWPEDAQDARQKLIDLGMKSQVEKFEETLNRAAEEASKGAVDIFVKAITSMTISDAMGILKGNDNAATEYLKKTTTDALKEKFRPIVQSAIDKVELTKYWNPLMTAYNKTTMLSGKPKINPDLKEFVTDKAITGLFKMVEKEEKKIRKDPIARVNDILKKVFGSLDK